MRIALITPFDPIKNFGGVERFVRELENGLTKQNIEVDIFYSSLHFPKFLKVSHSISLFYQLKNIKKYDLIHAQGWVGWLSLFKSSTPFITSLHGTSVGATKATERFHNPIRNFYNFIFSSNMEKIACHLSDRVTCVSRRVMGEAELYYKLDSNKCKIIYNGVDTKRFCPQKKLRSHDSPLCLAVGRLDVATKGLDYFDLITKKVKCEFLVAGTVTKKINAKVQQYKAIEMPNVYNSSDIFIQTSRYEGCSFALLEAMACGLPVVTFDIGAASEIVRDSIDGFLVPVGDIDSFADKINLLIEDQNLRKKMGKNARKRAELFSLDKMVNKYIKLYKEIIYGDK